MSHETVSLCHATLDIPYHYPVAVQCFLDFFHSLSFFLYQVMCVILASHSITLAVRKGPGSHITCATQWQEASPWYGQGEPDGYYIWTGMENNPKYCCFFFCWIFFLTFLPYSFLTDIFSWCLESSQIMRVWTVDLVIVENMFCLPITHWIL